MASVKVGASLEGRSVIVMLELLQGNAPWDDHELLESETATGVGATVQHVHEWHWEDVWLLGASEVANVGVEWDTLLSSGSLGHSHGHTEDGVGSELSLVLGAIELVEESIDGRLVLDVEVLLDESWSDLVVHVGDGLEDALKKMC
jgi:hypothetical protein